MENPTHVYTTGIPMSEKGNDGDHSKHGCDDGKSYETARILDTDESDFIDKSTLELIDVSCENDFSANNCIQDGDQSEILYNIVCGTGVPVGENLSIPTLHISSPQQSLEETNHAKFSEASSMVFTERINALSVDVDRIVQDMDEPLDDLVLVPDFKLSKNGVPEMHSDITTQSIEEQQKKLNESISAIAKSLGLEDMLPETFQVDNNKDVLSITVASELDSFGEVNVDPTSNSVLNDFEKCPVELHIPDSPLGLSVETDNLSLAGFGLLSPNKVKIPDYNNGTVAKLPVWVKDGTNRYFLCTRDELDQKNLCSVSSNNDVMFSTHAKSENSHDEINVSDVLVKNEIYDTSSNGANECVLETGASDFMLLKENIETNVESNQMVNSLPFETSEDANANNDLLSEVVTNSENSTPVGPATVSITTDKINKKMRIVILTNQGQQVYEINTDTLGTGSVPLINLQSVPEENDLQSNVLCLNEISDELEQKTLEAESEGSNNELIDDDDEVPFDEDVDLMQFVEKISASRGKQKSWACPVKGCRQVLNTECKLRVHMINHKSTRPFKCSFGECDWAFTTPYRLRRHLETHVGKKDYICDFEGCTRRFTTVYNLNTHKKRHKWPNAITCPAEDCGLSFANRRKMELHLRVHKDIEAPYKCSVCGKKYYSANCIASHYRTHQYNEDDFKCPFQGCGKKYDKICRLKQHIRHHTGDRPYTCPADGCKWSFMSASKLTRHMRKHTGERKFLCTEPGCGKSFMRPEHLKGHVVIHSGAKPFQCPHENCNAKFTAKSSLYVHVKKHCASGIKIVYACPLCIKKYNNKATLKQHIQKIHPTAVEDGKQIEITEKYELTMNVSIAVEPSNSECDVGLVDSGQNNIALSEAMFSELSDKNIVSKDLSLGSMPQLITTNHSVVPVDTTTMDNTVGSMLKLSDTEDHMSKYTVSSTLDQSNVPKFSSPPSEINLTSSKLLKENRSGSARTDYCCNHNHFLNLHARKWWLLQKGVCLNLLNNNEECRNQESNGSFSSVDIRSPDVMLASSSLAYQDQSVEHLGQMQFLSDEPSVSIYHDDSILVNNSAFSAELPMAVSLLPDNSDSDESILVSRSSATFSTTNTVDEFADSAIDLQGLDC